MFNPCAVIPVYNHEQALQETVDSVLAFNLPVVLIDDGSNKTCKQVMSDIAHNIENVSLITRDKNGGKGAAVKTGLQHALKAGYTHALQIDADGQHNPDDIPIFLKSAENNKSSLIAGIPRYDESIPKGRLYGRYLTHIWVWINTLSFKITDSMCGFRVYPLVASTTLIEGNHTGDRMDFDPEFIVRWHWENLPIHEIPTTVTYPKDGISHFLAWKDNKLISIMHTRLFFGMLIRSPKFIWQRFFGA
ncbi:MAG: glycosyltransferase family 2 protein [Cellvibrionaceae bacterium]